MGEWVVGLGVWVGVCRGNGSGQPCNVPMPVVLRALLIVGLARTMRMCEPTVHL